MEWSQCYWRLNYFYHEIKEYRWPQWDVKADFSKQDVKNAWVEAVNKPDSTIRIRITCQNGKYIILDTR
jgi:hypothetical protein